MWPWNTREYRDNHRRLRRNYTGLYRRDPAPDAAAPAVTDFMTVKIGPGAGDTFTPSDAQARLAEVEQLLADHARSEGRTPSGSVKQQVQALIDRLDEQDKQSI